MGLVDSDRAGRVRQKTESLAAAHKLSREAIVDGLHLEKWFRRPENTWQMLPESLRAKFASSIWELLETDLKYAGYLDRQEDMVARAARMEDRSIPATFDYAAIRGLKREAQIKLTAIRPQTIGQASRIQGVTPADVALLTVILERPRAENDEASNQKCEGMTNTE
jgi:tRNA uridine 5-carboxymethylaminomethyl modification enzyme